MKRGEHPVLCQECQQRTANVHYTKVVNGQKTEYHLCEQCAREKGEIDLSFGFDPGFSIHNLLAGLLDMDNPVTQLSKTAAADQRCPSCGLNYAEFSQSGRLGCAYCYGAFAQQLEPLLRRIQGSTEHNGKIPERTDGVLKLEQEIRKLNSELEEAVAKEEYEQAAKLRDRIKELRQQAEQGGQE